uniref:Uncharacterized protein n=1 Tax=Cyanoderma ruficeps TaxID=181631 RepID=A0A8C3QK24_9PASS
TSSALTHPLPATPAYEERQRKQGVFDHPAEAELKMASDCHKNQVWTSPSCLLRENNYKLSSGDHENIMAICTKDIHGRDVSATLQAQKVHSLAWPSQVCHRWDDVQKYYFANISDAWFQYFYEHLGTTPWQVTTPLTDSYKKAPDVVEVHCNANNPFSYVEVLYYSNPKSPPSSVCCSCRTSWHG